jgi:hypothetical protein
MAHLCIGGPILVSWSRPGPEVLPIRRPLMQQHWCYIRCRHRIFENTSSFSSASKNPKANPLEGLHQRGARIFHALLLEKKGTMKIASPATHRNAPPEHRTKMSTPADARRQVPMKTAIIKFLFWQPSTATRRHAQDWHLWSFTGYRNIRRDADLQEDVAAEVYADWEDKRAERTVSDGIERMEVSCHPKQSAKKATNCHGWHGTKKSAIVVVLLM